MYQEAVNGVNKGEGGPFGAVILKDGELIAVAHNTVITTNDPTAHAEINAIRQASQKLQRFDLSDCILVTSSEPVRCVYLLLCGQELKRSITDVMFMTRKK